MTERLDLVTIALDRIDVVLRWKASAALLDEVANLESDNGITEAFEAAGETQPVTLTIEQKAQLLLAIEQWSVRTPGGFTALPEGIYDLREGLHNDLHDAR